MPKSGDRGPKSTKEHTICPTVAPFHPKMERGNGCEAGGPMGPRARVGGLGCGLGTHQGARARQEGGGIESAFLARDLLRAQLYKYEKKSLKLKTRVLSLCHI